jgi:hypothetical protein
VNWSSRKVNADFFDGSCHSWRYRQRLTSMFPVDYRTTKKNTAVFPPSNDAPPLTYTQKTPPSHLSVNQMLFPPS